MPMLVSTDLPRSTAVMLAPFPRWAITTLSSDSLPPSRASALWLTDWKEVPWKPYRRTPWSA